jgi:photosystem II stability/assembly factor-like uncharacterized protein
MSAITLDPLIAEAKRRARRRRWMVVAILAVAAGSGVAIARSGSHPSPSPDVGAVVAPPVAPAGGPQAEILNAGSTGPVTWALGNNRFWLTADSGATWRPLPPAFGKQGKFILVNTVGPIQFIDRNHGWVFSGAAPRDLYRTIDGGRTWIPTRLPRRVAQDASSVYFVSPTDGYFLSDRALRATHDGGATWQVVSRLPGPYGGWGLRFSDRLRGFFVASGSRLYGTTDGGHTWKSVLRPRGRSFELWTPSVFGRRVVAPDLVYVRGQGPDGPIRVVVYSSSDGGLTWTSRAVPKLLPPARDHGIGPPTIGFTALSPTEWVAQRGETILVTADAGRSWRTVTAAQRLPGFLIGTGFSSPRVGWGLLQRNGLKFRITLLRTTDGGRH